MWKQHVEAFAQPKALWLHFDDDDDDDDDDNIYMYIYVFIYIYIYIQCIIGSLASYVYDASHQKDNFNYITLTFV